MVGLLTVDDPRAKQAQVYLNGENVTADTFAVDDRHGWVARYLRDPQGHRYLLWPPCGHTQRVPGCPCATYRQRPATTLLMGDVRVVLAEAT
jgi:hypothetical protein